MKKLIRPRKPKPDPFREAFKGLPAIDFDRAAEMLKASDFSVPENWPANWPWLIAMRDALIKAGDLEKRARLLRHSVSTFREMLERGDPWPTAQKESQE